MFYLRKEIEMSEPIIFISHFKVKEGKLDSLLQLSNYLKTPKIGVF